MSVNTRIGTLGRCDATTRALKPLFVKTMSAGALSMPTAAAARRGDRELGRHAPYRCGDSFVALATAAASISISAMMRLIASTASRGYCPAAVSAESITASVPSRIALATSLASARVGRGCVIIDSSICVAVITGRPSRLQSAMMRFCAYGTSSNGSSTPEIAARDHHAVRRANDRFNVL